MTRPCRDEAMMRLAEVWATLGTCSRRLVGCVLVDADGFQLSSGYNGVAANQPHCLDRPCAGAGLPSGTGLDACEAVHAEANALIRCLDPRRIHTCYVTTSPCRGCVKMLLNTGCVRVVFRDEYPHPDARELWLSFMTASGRLERRWEQLESGVLMRAP